MSYSPTSSVDSEAILTENMERENDEDSPEDEDEFSLDGYFTTGGVPPDDVFDLSLCSGEVKQTMMHDLFGLTRVTFNDGRFVAFIANRRFENDETKIEVQVIEQSKTTGKFKRLTNYLKGKVLRKVLGRKINGKDYEIEKTIRKDYGVDLSFDGLSYRCVNFRKQFLIHTEDVSSAYSDLLAHLFHLFPNETPLFFLDLRGIAADSSAIFRHLFSCHQIRNCPCLAMGVRNNEFVGQAHVILETMSELKNLNLDIGISDTEFFSLKMCSIDHLTVHYNNNGISTQNFLSLKCETIKLWNVSMSSQTLNAFIKQWISSSDRRFRCLEIPIMILEENPQIQDVLEGIKFELWDKAKRAEWFKLVDWNYELNCTGKIRHLSCKSAIDVSREDGALASILISTTFFFFLVWHQKFPEQPEDHIPFLDE